MKNKIDLTDKFIEELIKIYEKKYNIKIDYKVVEVK
jgi:transposase